MRLSDVEYLDDNTQFALFVPRHALAREIKAVIERNLKALGRSVTVPILRGRDQDAENGGAPCRRWKEARELGSKGLPVYSNLCRRTQGGETSECHYFADCEYIRSWRGAYRSPFVILVHAYLGLEWKSESYARIAGIFDIDNGPASEPSFNPAYASTIVCDEDPTQSLVEETKFGKAVLGSIREHGLGELILEGLNASAGLLSYLREKEITPEQLRATAETLKHDEGDRGQIANPSEADAVLGHQAATAQPLVRLSRVLERLADELVSQREGRAYSLIASEGGYLISQGRRRWAFEEQRLLLLDGTADPEILKAFVPNLEVADEIRVKRNARVIQVIDRTFYKGSLLQSANAEAGESYFDPKRRDEIRSFIDGIASEAKTLVVTNKPVRCKLTGEDCHAALPISGKFGGADIAHFGNIRGSNEFERHDTVIILGRDEPSVRGAEQRAKAIWYDTKEPIKCIDADRNGRLNYPKRFRDYTMRDRIPRAEKVSVHPDRRVQAVVEQARQAEMLQAVDRLRLIHSKKRKTVYILCNIPLDIPVDELVTWKQLIGDRRLIDALAECDAKGWDAMPLAARELNRLFPKLWPTTKAAKRWGEKKPLASNIYSIRVWGLLTEYRPVGQTSWSKSLIRRGVQDRASALAKVLAISPESLNFRDEPQKLAAE